MSFNSKIWRWQEHYVFLEVLRESGVTNMFGATPYLMRNFDLDEKTAKQILVSWMRNYDKLKQEGVI